MSADRYSQTAHVKAAERRRALAELRQLGADIGRCHKTISSVMTELNSVNAKFKGERTTRDEVEFLTALLGCAKKKLAWEKQIASLNKRAPELLARMSNAMTDQHYPPSDEMKAEMLESLQLVRDALEKLQAPEINE